MISSSKCTALSTKPVYKSNGKPDGYAVVGRAAVHERWDVVKHNGERQQFQTQDAATAAMRAISKELQREPEAA